MNLDKVLMMLQDLISLAEIIVLAAIQGMDYFGALSDHFGLITMLSDGPSEQYSAFSLQKIHLNSKCSSTPLLLKQEFFISAYVSKTGDADLKYGSECFLACAWFMPMK
jgi:hypothetical protein